ncbi:MAG TPA: alpha/beta-hydrolase family protein, partial [Vicinamibacterales bacterium]
MRDTGRRGAFGTPTLSGSSLALLFWWQSLTPTLIPRSWEMQAVVGAICLVIGYAIGTLAGHWAHRRLRWWGRSPGSAIHCYGWIVLGAVWLVGVLMGATLWKRWQDGQRNIMGIAPLDWFDAVMVGVLSPFAGMLLVLAGRVVVNGVTASNRFIQRNVPAIVLAPLTAVLVVLLSIAIARGVAFRVLASAAYSVYAPANEQTTEGILAPDSSSVSGSPTSFVAWDSLGYMGRDFVATASTIRDLQKFHRAEAALTAPVRVYVGLRSADTAAARAALAVRELERAGGFDRKVLVVWVPTGTGWMIPKAAAALEQLYRGDTAIVAIQYSFLPSLLAAVVNAGLANEAGTLLFNAVRARWSELPSDRRPKLVLFGKSLGTAGVEAPFVGFDASSSVSNMVTRTDGVLIAGAKHSNPIHAQLTRERDLGSPVWFPVFDRGRSVRFVNRGADRPELDAEWSAPRLVYLQHPSDPTVFWSIAALWRQPEWMEQPRGFDVSDNVHWFPIVSA